MVVIIDKIKLRRVLMLFWRCYVTKKVLFPFVGETESSSVVTCQSVDS